MADRFEDLRTYIAVVDNGGVNSAAVALGIAKSAVSRRLSELEERLGVTLIDRSTRRFETTLTGRHYYEGARRILSELVALDGLAGETGQQPLKVAIACAPALHGLATTAAARVAASLQIETLEIQDARAGGDEAHVWLGAAPQDANGFVRVEAGQSIVTIVAAPSVVERGTRPTTAHELQLRPRIGISSRTDLGWPLGARTEHQFAMAMIVPDEASALAAAVAGAGFARLPERLTVRDMAQGNLERISVPGIPEAELITMWIRSDAPPVVKRLADLMLNDFANTR